MSHPWEKSPQLTASGKSPVQLHTSFGLCNLHCEASDWPGACSESRIICRVAFSLCEEKPVIPGFWLFSKSLSNASGYAGSSIICRSNQLPDVEGTALT